MKLNILTVIVVSLLLNACKVQIKVPVGGSVQSDSGAYSCAAGQICEIDVVDLFFDETFTAVPASGYEFTSWKKRDSGFFGGHTNPSVRLFTSDFPAFPALLPFLESDQVFYLSPNFFLQDQFTVEWLSGRTLYAVAFVGGGDDPDYAEVVRFSFSNNGTLSYEEIMNDLYSGESVFDVTDDGLLFFEGNSSDLYQICEITGDYLKTIRTEDGEYDNVELFFFEREAALEYASSLTDTVPGC
jgi:hypothetical protein